MDLLSLIFFGAEKEDRIGFRGEMCNSAFTSFFSAATAGGRHVERKRNISRKEILCMLLFRRSYFICE